MINSLGATPLEELYIISKRVDKKFLKLKIEFTKTYVLKNFMFALKYF